jgi:hypothetical protein
VQRKPCDIRTKKLKLVYSDREGFLWYSGLQVTK